MQALKKRANSALNVVFLRLNSLRGRSSERGFSENKRQLVPERLISRCSQRPVLSSLQTPNLKDKASQGGSRITRRIHGAPIGTLGEVICFTRRPFLPMDPSTEHQLSSSMPLPSVTLALSHTHRHAHICIYIYAYLLDIFVFLYAGLTDPLVPVCLTSAFAVICL